MRTHQKHGATQSEIPDLNIARARELILRAESMICRDGDLADASAELREIIKILDSELMAEVD